jgi:hypothetical protein
MRSCTLPPAWAFRHPKSESWKKAVEFVAVPSKITYLMLNKYNSPVKILFFIYPCVFYRTRKFVNVELVQARQ